MNAERRSAGDFIGEVTVIQRFESPVRPRPRTATSMTGCASAFDLLLCTNNVVCLKTGAQFALDAAQNAITGVQDCNPGLRPALAKIADEPAVHHVQLSDVLSLTTL